MLRGMLRSTTVRFAALVFLLQVVAAAFMLGGLGAVMRQQSRAQALDTVETLRDDLMATTAQGGERQLVEAIRLRLANEVGRGVVVALVDPSGRLVEGNLARMPDDGFAVHLNRVASVVNVRRRNHAADEAALIVAARLPGGQLLLAGTVVESDRQFLALLERASIATLALSLLLAGLASFLATRQIVQRLRGTVATLEAVGAGDLARRVPPDGSGDAFSRLGEEVNRALARAEALNGELKIATDVLAHDLKSPLTRLLSALDRASARAEDAEALAAVEQAEAEARRVLSIIDTALGISKAEAGFGRESFTPVDLGAMLETIAEIYAPVVEEEGRRMEVQAPPGLVVPIHRQLMDQAIGNLLDNTIRYGAGAISLAVEPRDGAMAISVADEGPGIPQHQHEEALRRFGRLDEARGGWGAGLGLALVEAVAHLHGGRVELAENRQSRSGQPGLKVTLVLGQRAPGGGDSG
ncbi:periplasmic sensor signal transduction histidine kinase [Novosphingobium aromaticivorans DSM 12444]|uniref:histidine kinase n=2 Tax=Novosphingobium aromaticivorans TaxID=48935 RepID=Q2G7Y3_NOVAD|nr:HAMP domain-containing sensor histidine kinase [Novosphingobium aromaticivorans]ABD26040.1 periplasmic sensor signal transduction histidine kinase [Novosphingobium aromaticivorans DSM 12444]SCY60878.1 Signal transduction histidine kinase [Novosphingobium aromaticivorans]